MSKSCNVIIICNVTKFSTDFVQLKIYWPISQKLKSKAFFSVCVCFFHFGHTSRFFYFFFFSPVSSSPTTKKQTPNTKFRPVPTNVS